MNRTDELRTARIESLVTPAELALRYPVTPGVATHVTDSRRRIEKILNGEDKRLLVIIGPCSIHDLTAAMEYATRLQSLRNQYQSRLEIVMRTYFEKPRTVVGWKGLISDPDLNGSYRINHGLELARKLLLQVNELGVPTATEFLDMVTGQFIADLISWGAIGARTTESQIHREMASALSCPVGFKNGTDGNTRIAVDAIRAARASHMFLSPDKNGQMTIYQTSGNPYGHIIMRGGKKPNYHADDIAAACDTLHEEALAHAGCRFPSDCRMGNIHASVMVAGPGERQKRSAGQHPETYRRHPEYHQRRGTGYAAGAGATPRGKSATQSGRRGKT